MTRQNTMEQLLFLKWIRSQIDNQIQKLEDEGGLIAQAEKDPLLNVLEDINIKSHKELYNNILTTMELPQGLEKRILRLICFCDIFLLENFKKYFEKLFFEMEIEGLKSFLLKRAIDYNLLLRIDSNKLEASIQEMRKVLERFLKTKLQIFDVRKLLNLVKESEPAIKEALGNDLILVLGRTGVGKSTVVHWLAGSEMSETSVYIDNSDSNAKLPFGHLGEGSMTQIIADASQTKKKQLESVIINKASRSVTKCIISVPVNTKDLGFIQDKAFILCDSPGFFDTEGQEVDLANYITIKNLLKSSKSVRLLVLFSYKSIGDRLELLKEGFENLNGILPDINNYLSSIAFGFTNFPKNMISNFKAELGQAKQNEPGNSLYYLFLENLIKIIERKREDLFIKPISRSEAEEFFKYIIELPAINDPEDVFSLPLSMSLKKRLLEQLELDRQSLSTSLKFNEYENITYKVNMLNEVAKKLNDDAVVYIYESAIQNIVSYLEDIIAKTKSSFNRCIENRGLLDVKDIEEYTTALVDIRCIFEACRSYLCNKQDYSKSLIINITEQALKLKEAFLKNDLSGYNIQNLSIIYNKFNYIDVVNDCYKGIIKIFFDKFCLLYTDAISALQKFEHSNFLDSFKKMELIENFFSLLEGSEKQVFFEKKEHYKNQFIISLSEIARPFFKPISEFFNFIKQTGENDFENMFLFFLELERNSEYLKYLPVENIKKELANLKKHLCFLFKLLTEQINSKIGFADFNELPCIFEPLNYLKYLNKLMGSFFTMQEYTLEKTYSNIIFDFEKKLKLLAGEIFFLYRKIFSEGGDEKEGLIKVCAYVGIFKRLEWYKEFDEDIYQKMLSELDCKFAELCKEFFIDKFDFDYENFDPNKNLYDLQKFEDSCKAICFIKKIRSASFSDFLEETYIKNIKICNYMTMSSEKILGEYNKIIKIMNEQLEDASILPFGSAIISIKSNNYAIKYKHDVAIMKKKLLNLKSRQDKAEKERAFPNSPNECQNRSSFFIIQEVVIFNYFKKSISEIDYYINEAEKYIKSIYFDVDVFYKMFYLDFVLYNVPDFFFVEEKSIYQEINKKLARQAMYSLLKKFDSNLSSFFSIHYIENSLFEWLCEVIAGFLGVLFKIQEEFSDHFNFLFNENCFVENWKNKIRYFILEELEPYLDECFYENNFSLYEKALFSIQSFFCFEKELGFNVKSFARSYKNKLDSYIKAATISSENKISSSEIEAIPTWLMKRWDSYFVPEDILTLFYKNHINSIEKLQKKIITINLLSETSVFFDIITSLDKLSSKEMPSCFNKMLTPLDILGIDNRKKDTDKLFFNKIVKLINLMEINSQLNKFINFEQNFEKISHILHYMKSDPGDFYFGFFHQLNEKLSEVIKRHNKNLDHLKTIPDFMSTEINNFFTVSLPSVYSECLTASNAGYEKYYVSLWKEIEKGLRQNFKKLVKNSNNDEKKDKDVLSIILKNLPDYLQVEVSFFKNTIDVVDASFQNRNGL